MSDSAALAPDPTIILTEDEFDAQYTPITPLDANGYEGDTVHPTADGLDLESKHLWTIITGDDGNLYASSGWHYVNCLGYILTEEAWSQPTEGEWAIFEDSDDENDDE